MINNHIDVFVLKESSVKRQRKVPLRDALLAAGLLRGAQYGCRPSAAVVATGTAE
jgi:hypothetical protein